MAIDDSGQYWTGSEPADLEAFLRTYAEEETRIDAYRAARCACGGEVFGLETDDDEGAARRTCAGCGAAHLIGDSAEVWDDATPERWTCLACESVHGNVGAAFSLRESGDVRAVFLGVRCATCGLLGCVAEWPINYTPSAELVERV